jgi:hypothetical protein
MKTGKLQEVVFERGFVPMLTAPFTVTEDEIRHFRNLRESGESIHIIINPMETVAFKGKELRSSAQAIQGVYFNEGVQ